MRRCGDNRLEWRMAATIAAVRQPLRAAYVDSATAGPAPQLCRVLSQLHRQAWSA